MDNRIKKPSCPPRMSDGRHFTDFRTRSGLESDHYFAAGGGAVVPGRGSEHDYRRALQSKASDIVLAARRLMSESNKCV
jgi:hypothetical protein